MSPKDWKTVDEALGYLYGQVKLQCEGFELTLTLLPGQSRFKNAIQVYVNNRMEGGWYLEDCEERRRFFCPKKICLWSAKARKNFGRMGKRTLKALKIDPYAFTTAYSSQWTSFRRMKAHLVKHNDKITLIRDDRETEVA